MLDRTILPDATPDNTVHRTLHRAQKPNTKPRPALERTQITMRAHHNLHNNNAVLATREIAGVLRRYQCQKRSPRSERRHDS